LLLSGHTLRPQDVVLLAELVENKRLAAKLRDAARLNADVVLSIQERVDILAVLDEPPPELQPLRGHLLSQLKERDPRPWHSWPTAEG
jgi:hypothetical protein